jgi:hypothetical protein
MKTMLKVIFALLLVAPLAFGKTESKKKKRGIEKSRLESMGAKLGTDFKMTGLDVGGRYQSASVGLSTVENDKPLYDLLDYDNNFKSRSEAARSWK